MVTQFTGAINWGHFGVSASREQPDNGRNFLQVGSPIMDVTVRERRRKMRKEPSQLIAGCSVMYVEFRN